MLDEGLSVVRSAPTGRADSIRGYFRLLPPGEMRDVTGWGETMNSIAPRNSFMRFPCVLKHFGGFPDRAAYTPAV
jgi:hypothetical protein